MIFDDFFPTGAGIESTRWSTLWAAVSDADVGHTGTDCIGVLPEGSTLQFLTRVGHTHTHALIATVGCPWVECAEWNAQALIAI